MLTWRVTASVKADALGHSNSTVAIDYTRCGRVSHLSNSASGLTPGRIVLLTSSSPAASGETETQVN